ncbi:serine hydrolase [Candidatus Poribacteria bacterium]|nr:serine hydrolase [Candidatus Poribacteria bacterium]
MRVSWVISPTVNVFLILTFIVLHCALAGIKNTGESLKTLSGAPVSISALEASVSQIMEKAGVTGLSCAIINDSEIVYQKAFGLKNKNSGARNDEETIFSAASFSKTVFAYLVMLLVEEKIIDLDKPLYEYLNQPLHEYPAYEGLKEDGRYKQMTARMVLSHSTGFPNWRFLTRDGKLNIMFPPGERFNYSGAGIVLLQMVIEEITGRCLEELSQEKIFASLGMTRSSYIWQKEYENNFALPHDEFERPQRLSRWQKADAAGSMLTTAGDYARFLVGILNAKGKRKASIEEMLKPQISITSERMFGPGAWEDTDENRALQLSWGLGWGRFNGEHGRAFFHTGHGFGWQNYTVTYADRGIGIVLLSNSDNFESVAKEIVERAIGDIHSPFDWLGYIPFDPSRKKVPPPEPVAIEVNQSILETYVGVYEVMPGEMIFIKFEQDSLFCSSDSAIWEQMFAESETRFFVKLDNARFPFLKDAAGMVTGLSLQIQGLELPAKKVK